MKLDVSKDLFVTALALLSKIPSSRSVIPVLHNFMLEAKDGSLTIKASNIEQAATINIEAVVYEEGATTVHAKTFMETVELMNGEVIAMEYTPATGLYISTGKSKMKLAVLDADEFPNTGFAEGPEILLPAQDLSTAIVATVLAASVDESRPTLTGVEVTFDKNIRFAATDGYRLATYLLEADIQGEQTTAIIPAKSLKQLAVMLGDAEDIALHLDDTRLTASFSRVKQPMAIVFTTSIIDAKFPDYNAIIPKTHLTRSTIKIAPFRNALNLANLAARVNSGIVGLTINPASQTIVVSANSLDGNTAETTIDAEIEGEGIDIKFNVTYLLAALTPISDTSIVLETTANTRPGTIYPPDKKDIHLQVVMPMHPSR